jgi:hypothetical protein
MGDTNAAKARTKYAPLSVTAHKHRVAGLAWCYKASQAPALCLCFRHRASVSSTRTAPQARINPCNANILSRWPSSSLGCRQWALYRAGLHAPVLAGNGPHTHWVRSPAAGQDADVTEAYYGHPSCVPALGLVSG